MWEPARCLPVPGCACPELGWTLPRFSEEEEAGARGSVLQKDPGGRGALGREKQSCCVPEMGLPGGRGGSSSIPSKILPSWAGKPLCLPERF